MRLRRRAFLLILSLFVVTLITVLILALLGAGPMTYRSSMNSSFEQQARWLAQAGVEDVRTKLQRDYSFPPPMETEGLFFSYSEEFMPVGGGSHIGTFDVTVDLSAVVAPYYVVSITSTGRLMLQSQEVRKTIRAELDVSPKDRRTGHETETNPNFYRIINWAEEGQ